MAEEKRIEISSTVLPSGTIVVKPVGKLDVFTFTELKKFIAEICTQAKVVFVVVDLGEVDYIASSGWSVLLSRRQSIRRDGGDLSIFGMNENLMRVYEAMRIDKMLPCGASLDEATALLKADEQPQI